MSDDLNEQLGKLALMAETANHWTDEHRLMPAAGVADIVYDAIQRIEELEANINIKADFIDATMNQLAASDQRIEELKKACDEEEIRSVGWAEVSQSNYQRAKAAEAKLEKALAELERLGFDFQCIVGRELKGQDDEV